MGTLRLAREPCTDWVHSGGAVVWPGFADRSWTRCGSLLGQIGLCCHGTSQFPSTSGWRRIMINQTWRSHAVQIRTFRTLRGVFLVDNWRHSPDANQMWTGGPEQRRSPTGQVKER